METEKQIDTLNELLKGEHMAIHIYDKTKGLQRDDQIAAMLTKFQHDHQRHAEQLTQRIKVLGGTPDAGTGLAGIMADVSAVIDTLKGNEDFLTHIYNGEDKGIHAYEDRFDEIDVTSKGIVKQIMEEDHEHLKWFKSRMEKEKSEFH